MLKYGSYLQIICLATVLSTTFRLKRLANYMLCLFNNMFTLKVQIKVEKKKYVGCRELFLLRHLRMRQNSLLIDHLCFFFFL